ncbi:MAG: catalase [Candidatus Methanoliparum thermophilum]|uniref:Catalase n=2 Tax=Candidatus Methanoliparum TaxID=2545692 RepID=A0A520KQV8_METT2|nr:MAG: catalase [Candidatus Methanoliparum thermophilum]
MTTNQGAPVSNDQSSQTAGEAGPVLLQDYELIEKLAHFVRERIPERVVHARGAGAHGYFESYGTAKDYTIAKFLQDKGKITKVFVRFSTVIHSKHSPETARDPRGFAVKFYTEEGNYDIVGNNLPVFFIRDAIKFPDVIHALTPDPATNIQDPKRYWDFFSKTPEATNMITYLWSDLGIPKDYRHMNGFGVNTFVWVNAKGERRYVKYHWVSKQGVESLSREEAAKISDFNHATRDLYEAIERGEYPEWELCVQLMDPEKEVDFDPLDDTKIWSEPLIPIGRMVLNRNPKNFFAEVEQAAFAPSALVPGIEPSADKMLQGRLFAYNDAQRYRLGPNYLNLPINRPMAEVYNNQRDGSMTFDINEKRTNYYPSNNKDALKESPEYPTAKTPVSGYVGRYSVNKGDDFSQAGALYRSFSEKDKIHLIDNIAVELKDVDEKVRKIMISYFTNADKDYGARVAERIKELKS